ncbi:MAG: hypothetical protein AB8C46_09205 [Burkholderiaceae bacterium]
MSLLIKALRQAEKQNERAARQAGEVAIELPPEAEDKPLPSKAQAHAPTPLSSALDMALETQGVSSRSDASMAGDDSFPALDAEFEPTAGQHNHDNNPVEANSTKELTQDSQDLRDVNTLSLEPAEPMAMAPEGIGEDSDRPPEAFARHSTDPALEPSIEEPGDTESREAGSITVESLPAAPLDVKPVKAAPEPEAVPGSEVPQEPSPSVANDSPVEAAPYLDVNAVKPVRRTVRTPVMVITGLALASLSVAAIVAAIMWWSGNEAYEADFDNLGALNAGNFATGNEPLSQLDLGVPVEGTVGAATNTIASEGITSGEVAAVTAASEALPETATAVSTSLEQPAALQKAATTTQTTGSSTEPADQPAVATNKSVPQSSAGAISSTGNSSGGNGSSTSASGTKAPEPRVQSSRSASSTVPATNARPALPAVRFVRSTQNREQPQQLLNDAYRALQSNELTRAQAAYQQALRIDRNLIDGWVGLASIAARQGNRTLASQHYQRALNIDPNDQVARTGLLALAGGNLPDESESTLRTLIDSGGQNAMAELALGNTLARQGRWAEAQQAYFNANALQPNQPDTVFNLAVSLERIRQPRAALSYYEQSLELSEGRETLFDPAAARQRIESLRQQPGVQ